MFCERRSLDTGAVGDTWFGYILESLITGLSITNFLSCLQRQNLFRELIIEAILGGCWVGLVAVFALGWSRAGAMGVLPAVITYVHFTTTILAAMLEPLAFIASPGFWEIFSYPALVPSDFDHFREYRCVEGEDINII